MSLTPNEHRHIAGLLRRVVATHDLAALREVQPDATEAAEPEAHECVSDMGWRCRSSESGPLWVEEKWSRAWRPMFRAQVCPFCGWTPKPVPWDMTTSSVLEALDAMALDAMTTRTPSRRTGWPVVCSGGV